MPIYYEARLAKLKLREEMKPQLDPEFEAITEGEEETAREREAQQMVGAGSDRRHGRTAGAGAADIVAHFEQRQEIMEGKGDDRRP